MTMLNRFFASLTQVSEWGSMIVQSSPSRQRRLTCQQALRSWRILGVGLSALAIASPAFAHHALSGRLPANFGEGFLSGIAHPVIGLDHFAFVVAMGLLGAQLSQSLKKSIWIPISFVVATILGVGVHLLAVNIPAAESIVATTIIVMGALLVWSDRVKASLLLGIGAMAGIFHGYAYGEAIVGSQMTPLAAYLLGLMIIQLLVALAAFGSGRVVRRSVLSRRSAMMFRYAGLAFSVLGTVFLSTTL